MAAIGSVWGSGTWTDDIWGDGTWGTAEAAEVETPGQGGTGGGGPETASVPSRTLGRVKPRRKLPYVHEAEGRLAIPLVFTMRLEAVVETPEPSILPRSVRPKKQKKPVTQEVPKPKAVVIRRPLVSATVRLTVLVPAVLFVEGEFTPQDDEVVMSVIMALLSKS